MVAPKNENLDVDASLSTLQAIAESAKKEASELTANVNALHGRQDDLTYNAAQAEANLFDYIWDLEHEGGDPEQSKLAEYKQEIQKAKQELGSLNQELETATHRLEAVDSQISVVTEVLTEVLAEAKKLAALEDKHAAAEGNFKGALGQVKFEEESKAYESASASFTLAETKLTEAQQRLEKVEKNSQSMMRFFMSDDDVNVAAAQEAVNAAQAEYGQFAKGLNDATRECAAARDALGSERVESGMLDVRSLAAQSDALQTQIDASESKISDIVSQHVHQAETPSGTSASDAVKEALNASDYGAPDPVNDVDNVSPIQEQSQDDHHKPNV